MNIGKNTSWQVTAVAAAALVAGVAQAHDRNDYPQHHRHLDRDYYRDGYRGDYRGYQHGYEHHWRDSRRVWVPLPPIPHWQHHYALRDNPRYYRGDWR